METSVTPNGHAGHAVGADRMEDTDAVTDELLHKETKSKVMTKILRMVSTIKGGKTLSRSQLFYDVDSTSDLRLWTVNVSGQNVRCARVYNPTLLRDRHPAEPESESVASAWAQLVRVERLEIEDPESMMTELPRLVASDIHNLTSLSLTWTRVKSLPPELFLTPLRLLNVQRNHLKHLNGVEKALRLVSLDVSNNHLEELPKEFGQLMLLEMLNVSGNQIKELPAGIVELTRLRTLDCSCNRLSALPDNIGNMLELSSIYVCGNQLASLPESIGSLPRLEDLRARGNHLSHLPQSFTQMTTLQSLLLRRNKFERMPLELARLPNLQDLNMSENKLQEVGVTMSAIRSLILDSNELTHIDEGILSCSSLQLLSLQQNRITELPLDISRLRNLNTLQISANEISELPRTLREIDELRHLSMNKTKLKEVPQVVLDMTQLVELELNDCTDLDLYVNLVMRKDGLPGVRNYYISLQEEEKLQEEQLQRKIDANGMIPRESKSSSTSEGEVSLVYFDDIDSRRKTLHPSSSRTLPPKLRPQLEVMQTHVQGGEGERKAARKTMPSDVFNDQADRPGSVKPSANQPKAAYPVKNPPQVVLRNKAAHTPPAPPTQNLIRLSQYEVSSALDFLDSNLDKADETIWDENANEGNMNQVLRQQSVDENRIQSNKDQRDGSQAVHGKRPLSDIQNVVGEGNSAAEGVQSIKSEANRNSGVKPPLRPKPSLLNRSATAM